MKTLNDKLPMVWISDNTLNNSGIFLTLVLVWLTLPKLLAHLQPTVGLIDQGIWQLLLLSLISFIGVLSLSWWLLHRYWQILRLPALNTLVSQFKNLTSWQQIIFYWACFALFLLTAVGCLVAVL